MKRFELTPVSESLNDPLWRFSSQQEALEFDAANEVEAHEKRAKRIIWQLRFKLTPEDGLTWHINVLGVLLTSLIALEILNED